ncbi:MAG: hypothetical protein JNL28_17425 [Planctomycetes bacterium]|nr:hypothetical protein [Planctomycetota bacterium]
MKEKNRDLTQAVAKGELVPWETVAAEACERMRFSGPQKNQFVSLYLAPVPMTEDYLREKFGLDGIQIRPENLIELDTVLEESNRMGAEAFARFESAVNLELANKCARGDFYYGPFTTAADLRPRTQEPIFVSTFGIRGWAVKCVVDMNDIPHARPDVKTLEGMRSVQRPLIAKYLKTLRTQ